VHQARVKQRDILSRLRSLYIFWGTPPSFRTARCACAQHQGAISHARVVDAGSLPLAAHALFSKCLTHCGRNT